MKKALILFLFVIFNSIFLQAQRLDTLRPFECKSLSWINPTAGNKEGYGELLTSRYSAFVVWGIYHHITRLNVGVREFYVKLYQANPDSTPGELIREYPIFAPPASADSCVFAPLPHDTIRLERNQFFLFVCTPDTPRALVYFLDSILDYPRIYWKVDSTGFHPFNPRYGDLKLGIVVQYLMTPIEEESQQIKIDKAWIFNSLGQRIKRMDKKGIYFLLNKKKLIKVIKKKTI